MAMVIGSNVVQAAITLVDARTGCKFTVSAAFLIYIKDCGTYRAAVENSAQTAKKLKPHNKIRRSGNFPLAAGL
jgi:hypothetical protein